MRRTLAEKAGFQLIEVENNSSCHWELFKDNVEITALGKAKWGFEYIEKLSKGCPDCGGEFLPETESELGDIHCKDCDLIIFVDDLNGFGELKYGEEVL